MQVASEEVVKLDTLGPGSYFGEMALVVDEPRSATITAAERTLLVRISKQHFDAFLKVPPAIEEKVLHPLHPLHPSHQGTARHRGEGLIT